MRTLARSPVSLKFEVNGLKFALEVAQVREAANGEIYGAPLPHYVYDIKARRLDASGTQPIIIQYHGGVHEWARGKPAMNEMRLLNAFADFVIDAAMSVTKDPTELIEAWAMDVDMANKTWRTFKARFKELQDKFHMTTDEIVQLGNVLWKLQINGRLNELIAPGGRK